MVVMVVLVIMNYFCYECNLHILHTFGRYSLVNSFVQRQAPALLSRLMKEFLCRFYSSQRSLEHNFSLHFLKAVVFLEDS